MIVLDASALVELLFQTKVGKKVGEIIFENQVNLVAPELLSIEVLQVVRRFVNSKELSSERATAVFQDFNDLAISYYPHRILLPRIWELRKNFTAYDATYIALSEQLEATLLTCDGAFIKGFGKIHSAKILLLKN